MNFSTVPPCSRSVRSARSNHSDCTRRSDSGSSRSPSSVEPTQSQKSTVTVLRTSTGRVYGAREARIQGRASTLRAMFDTLANRLQDALGDLGRRSRLDEETVTRATREIRLALLEADVDFEVVKQFVVVGPRAGARAGGAEGPRAGPAGRQDRARGADRADGLGRLAARVRAAADGRPPLRPAGRRQDDRGGEARAPPAQAREEAARASSPPTCSARRRSTSSSSSAASSRCPSTAPRRPTRSSPRARGSSARPPTAATS